MYKAYCGHDINCSFTNGFFPDGLKVAKVCPVFGDSCKQNFLLPTNIDTFNIF